MAVPLGLRWANTESRRLVVRQNQIGVLRYLELKGVIGKMVESDRAFLLDFASKLAVRSIKSLGKS